LNLSQFTFVEKDAATSRALIDFHTCGMFDGFQCFAAAMLVVGTSIRFRGRQGEFATRAIHGRHDTRRARVGEGKCALRVRMRKRLESTHLFW
jgi:hypothetical protein